jgi:hypothetical protein
MMLICKRAKHINYYLLYCQGKPEQLFFHQRGSDGSTAVVKYYLQTGEGKAVLTLAVPTTNVFGGIL